MNANTEITLDAVHDAIVAAIRAQYPTLETVSDYPDERVRVATPACLVELADLEPGDMDPGTGQQAVLARFQARIVIGFRETKAKRAVRAWSAAFIAFLRGQRWGLPVGPARFVSAGPDEFSPELDQYEAWLIEWEQVLHLGETVWRDDGLPPAQLYLGYSPRIGPPHEADYRPVDGLPTEI